MTFTKEQIYDFVCNNLHELSDDSIMEINEDELGNEHVGKMYDFDDYVRGESFLDVYNSLAPGFSAYDDYFKYDGDYATSNDLSDFIDMDEIAEWITDEFMSDSADNYLDEGDCYGLHTIYIPLKEKMNAEEKPKHTEEEIQCKLRESLSTLTNDGIITLSTYTDTNYIPMMAFPQYVEDRSLSDVVAELVKSIPCHLFEFKAPFFKEVDGCFVSYMRYEAETELFENLDKIDDDLLGTTFPALLEIRKGNWEE